MAAALPGATYVSFHNKFCRIFLNLCSNKVFDFGYEWLEHSTIQTRHEKNDNFEPVFEPVLGP